MNAVKCTTIERASVRELTKELRIRKSPYLPRLNRLA
jgi:hypothetical protein